MLDVLGGDPYYVFGQPLILKVMPEYFDFSSSDMMEMPSWIRFFNLPLKCWSSTCLTKLSSMLGKPIHCDTPTASMTRLSYARVLIEVDMLIDLPSSINLVLPNGSTLTQQVMFESLPRLCKTCRIIGHTVSTCNKGTSYKRKKLEALVRSGCSSPLLILLLLRNISHIVQVLRMNHLLIQCPLKLQQLWMRDLYLLA